MGDGMKLIKIGTMTLVLICFLASTITAADMKGKSRIELMGGFWSGSNQGEVEISPGVVSGVSYNGGSAGLKLSHYVQNDVALFISAGVLHSSVETRVSATGVFSETVSVIPLLLGIRYYLGITSHESSWNPYLSAGLGTFIADQVSGDVSNTGVFTESRTLSTFGGQAGAGIDIRLNRFLMLGFVASYNVMSDFAQRIANRDNYNGGEFGVSISYLFGGN
jgi:outer membrane protein W